MGTTGPRGLLGVTALVVSLGGLGTVMGLAVTPAGPRALAWTDGAIRFHDNYADALREARQTGKPIFLEFRCAP